MEAPITPKQYKGYKKARRDKFAPSANDNYNKATFGITAEEFRRVQRAVDAYQGICQRPLPSLKVLNEQHTVNPKG